MEGVWHEIPTLLGQGIHILVAGDFKCIESSQEKLGGRAFVDKVDSREFQGFIEGIGLVDFDLLGPDLYGVIIVKVGRECGRGYVGFLLE